MATISVSLPSDGQTADASDYNTPITTIVDAINGGLDNDNIAPSAGIDGSKLATSGVGNTQLALGVPVQVVDVVLTGVATGTTTIPLDDTIPQSSEGIQFMTLAITPKSATNILIIEVTMMLANDGGASHLIGALFQDATANALAASANFQGTASAATQVTFTHKMVAGTTSATTFKVRGGSATAGTITFNGSAGSRLFGAIPKSSIVITEYKAA